MPYKYSYQNQYSCSPPPAFMLSISLLQAVVFVYNCVMFYKITGEVGLNGPVPHCSHLIFNPDKRYQVWRYLTYMMIHSGVFHAVFNILVQLVLGIPLEMVHGKFSYQTISKIILTKKDLTTFSFFIRLGSIKLMTFF